MDTDTLLQFFDYGHLKPKAQAVSKPFHDLAHNHVMKLPPNEQRHLALLDLLRAKDSAVRAGLMN